MSINVVRILKVNFVWIFFPFENRFPHMQQPSNEMIYDSLAQLMQEKKIYQTAKGYFIVTPEYVILF